MTDVGVNLADLQLTVGTWIGMSVSLLFVCFDVRVLRLSFF